MNIKVVVTLHDVRSGIDYDGIPDICDADILLQVGGMAKLAQTFRTLPPDYRVKREIRSNPN